MVVFPRRYAGALEGGPSVAATRLWNRLDTSPWWRPGIVAALIVVIFLIRIFFDEQGPLFLLPVLAASLWFGVTAGLATAVLCAALYALGIEVMAERSGEADPDVSGPFVLRLFVYSVTAGITGSLADSRRGLEREVRAKERALTEIRTIQETLAPPQPPPRPGLELATCYIPAESGVSGDFYLVTEGTEGSTVIAIGDVAGRGLGAAKRAWFVRTVLASSADFTSDPSQLLELANYSLIEESGRSEQFVTAACLVYDDANRTVSWSVAGHNAPLLLDRGAPPPDAGKPGLPLGVGATVGCTTASFTLDAGSGLLLYTDGLSEARRKNGPGASTLFGDERVARYVADMAGETPQKVVAGLRHAAEDFAGGALPDDLCLLAIRALAVHSPTSVS